MCDDCFLKCNQWQSFKEQCECSEQELRELSIKQVKSAINEIEFLDLGLEIKEEESDEENDNSLITGLNEQSNSSSEEDKPLLENVERYQSSSSDYDKPLLKRTINLLPSSICEVKMEKNQTKKSKQAVEIQKPLKLFVKKSSKYNSTDSFCISQTPISNQSSVAEKYTVCENERDEVQWDKEDTDYNTRSKSFTAYRCKDCNHVFRGLNVYELHFLEVHMNKEVSLNLFF